MKEMLVFYCTAVGQVLIIFGYDFGRIARCDLAFWNCLRSSSIKEREIFFSQHGDPTKQIDVYDGLLMYISLLFLLPNTTNYSPHLLNWISIEDFCCCRLITSIWMVRFGIDRPASFRSFCIVCRYRFPLWLALLIAIALILIPISLTLLIYLLLLKARTA